MMRARCQTEQNFIWRFVKWHTYYLWISNDLRKIKIRGIAYAIASAGNYK